MVFFVFLHMMRVFYHGAYKPPREFNWVVGVVLLFLTIMLSFTGYLLPWDQIAYWAITIGTNMAGYAPLFNTPSKLLLLGGLEVGQNTLLRFYVLHIMVFPLVAADLPGRPLLAHPEGRRDLWPAMTLARALTDAQTNPPRADADRPSRTTGSRRRPVRSTRRAGRRSTSSACRCRRGRTGCSRWSSRTPSSGSRRNPTTRS